MKIKYIISFSVVLISLVFLYGCGEDQETGDKPAGVKKIVITMIAKSSANPVFLTAKNGAISEAKRISEKYKKIDVTIDWNTPETEDALEQVRRIRNAIKDKTDAIIVSCSDQDSLTSAINEAVDAGIPVMTFDSDSPQSKRFAFYGPDDIAMGESVMKRLAELIDGRGKIAVLGGNINAPNLRERVSGIQKAAAEYPEIELVGVYYHAENETESIREMLRVQELYPDLKGWAMVGGWPTFGSELMNKVEPGRIKIVAVDALPVQLEYVEKNIVQVLFGQPTFKWGTVSVETVIDKIYRDKKVNPINRLNTIPVTIDNLGGWSRQLKAWGYQDIPEKYYGM